MDARNAVVTLGFVALAAATASAQTPIVYPAKNQTPQQQQKDEGECAAWAKQTTGVDPAVLAAAPVVPPPAAAAAPEQKKGADGTRLKGAARGAAAGAVAGEIIDNDAGQGAAAGAAVGAIASGGRARRESAAADKQAAQQQQQASAEQKAAQDQAEANKQQQLATYSRANSACLEGRGYVLK